MLMGMLKPSRTRPVTWAPLAPLDALAKAELEIKRGAFVEWAERETGKLARFATAEHDYAEAVETEFIPADIEPRAPPSGALIDDRGRDLSTMECESRCTATLSVTWQRIGVPPSSTYQCTWCGRLRSSAIYTDREYASEHAHLLAMFGIWRDLVERSPDSEFTSEATAALCARLTWAGVDVSITRLLDAPMGAIVAALRPVGLVRGVVADIGTATASFKRELREAKEMRLKLAAEADEADRHRIVASIRDLDRLRATKVGDHVLRSDEAIGVVTKVGGGKMTVEF